VSAWRSARAERVAGRVALAFGVFFTLAALWEITGPLPGGHLGNVAGSAICGENMLRWRMFACVPEYTRQLPGPAQYYTHHPYGVFLSHALAHAIFGHGWATTRLPAVVCSALSVLLLHRLARALWGPVPAAVAVAAFSLLPINLAFSSFASLEVEVIFAGLLFSWATARFFQTWGSRYVVLSALGALGACQADWAGLVLVGTTGLFAFARAYVLPRRWLGRVDDRQHAAWFAWVTAAAVGSLLLYLALFAKAGHLADLLSSAQARSAGAGGSLDQMFGRRRVMWVLLMLPALSLWTMALGVPASLARLVARQKPEEALPLAWLAAASFQYFVFKQGADVHIFWPHYFGVVAPLSAGALVACSLGLWSLAARRWAARTGGGDGGGDGQGAGPGDGLTARWDQVALALTLGPVAIVLALVGRVGLVQLYQSRLTGGRFDDGGRYIAVDQDRSQFAAWVGRSLPRESDVFVHSSLYPHWNVQYGLARPTHAVGAIPGPLPAGSTSFTTLFDARYMAPAELRALASRFALELVGPYGRFDRSSPHAPPRALAYRERQPGLLERYLVTGSDLVRSIGPGDDVFATREWREHLGAPGEAQGPLPRPPATADEARVAHNAAVARGAPAAELAPLRALAEGLAPNALRVSFGNDVQLLGWGVESGAATVVTLLWQTGPAFRPIDMDFIVRSWVVAPPVLWASVTDYFEKETAPPMALRPGLWKPGYLYAQRYVAMRRPGTERFEGLWVARGAPPPRPLDGRERVELFTLR
jgi:hypothetical protein